MSRRSSRPPLLARDRGIALIAVLWVVLLLSVIAGSLLMLTRTEVGLSRNLLLSAKAEALAEGGVHLGIMQILEGNLDPDWRADGTVHRVVLEAGTVEIAMQDAAGRIDVNTAPPELLAGLFQAGGLDVDTAMTLADRVADWRDADEDPQPLGAEQADYDAAGLDIRVGNAQFLSADEIQRVPGMDLEVHARIASALTIYSRQSGVDLLSASMAALLALPGVDEATAEAMIAARGDGEGLTGANLSGLLPAEARPLLGRPTGRIYHIRSHAAAGGGNFVLDAAVELSPNKDRPWRILAWQPAIVF